MKWLRIIIGVPIAIVFVVGIMTMAAFTNLDYIDEDIII